MRKKERFKAGRQKKGLNIRFDASHVEFFQTVSAEQEARLNEYYVKNSFLQSARDFESKKAFFIGRTGLGKTAILESIKRTTSPNSQLLVNPEDFAFTIMEKSEVLKELSRSKVNLDLFYKTLWKYILITEILKKRFGSERKAWLRRQIESVFNKPAKRAYEFLLKNEELGEGLTFSERIAAIVKRMEHSVNLEFKKRGLALSYGGTLTPDQKVVIQDALQEFELTDLNYFIKIMDQEVLPGQHYVVLVDDLDKNWIQNSVGIDFTRCLFETVFELNNTRSVKVIVSLRTNLFDQLKFHQREKYLAYIEQLHWTDDELKEIVEERFKTLFPISGVDVWKYIFPQEMTLDGGKSLPFFDYMKSRTNRRPRDMLLFISFALKLSQGRNSIKVESINQAEKDYSGDRLRSLFEEWENPYARRRQGP